jgi:hypothetical protein
MCGDVLEYMCWYVCACLLEEFSREALFGGHLVPLMYDVLLYSMSPPLIPFAAPADGMQVK